jgi:hypothetical protein
MVTMVLLCGFLNVHAGYGAPSRETDSSVLGDSSGSQGAPLVTGPEFALAIDADGHIDIPRDSNGHLLIKTASGRCGRRHIDAASGGSGSGADKAKQRGKGIVSEAAARENFPSGQ